jgi:hypothetical protein
MKRIVLVFGLIAGVMVSAMMLVSMAFINKINPNHSYLIGYTTMVLAFLMVYFGIRSYRDNVTGGVLGYWKGFTVGLLITLIACTCYATTWEFAYRKFAPDFYTKYFAQMMDKARASGATQAQLDAKTAENAKYMVMYTNPLMNFALTFIEPLPVGILIALASAGILRRRRRGSGGDVTIEGAMPSMGRS